MKHMNCMYQLQLTRNVMRLRNKRLGYKRGLSDVTLGAERLTRVPDRGKQNTLKKDKNTLAKTKTKTK